MELTEKVEKIARIYMEKLGIPKKALREGAFPIFCKCSWSRGKTTLTGFETLSGLTLRYVLLKHGGSHKKSGMHPFVMQPILL